MSTEKISKQLDEIDTNKINGLEKKEIEDFLANPEKVQELGDIMGDIFEAQSETLQEYKEIIGNICKKILENDTITDNQGRILLFYLKHFHHNEDPLGTEIIRNIVYEKEGKIKEYIINSSDGDATKQYGTKNNINDINKRFNTLPRVQEIKQQKCSELMESPDLTQEDIKWLQKYKLDYNLGEGMNNEIEKKIELAIANIEISETVLSNISENPLENLEKLCKGISKRKPNWQLIKQNIKVRDTENIKTEADIHNLIEKINETITIDNIGEYLELPKGTPEQDKLYITNNFLSIITKHIILHPGYKIGYGNEPEKLATGITLKDIVYDNELVLSAIIKLQEVKNKGSFEKLNKEDKEKEIKAIMKENNHILFDLRLKNIINSGNKESIGNIIEEIINYSATNYPSILDNFSKNNNYINNIIQTYKNVELEENRIKEVEKRLKEANDITIPQSLRDDFFNNKNHEIETFKIFERGSLFHHEEFYEKIKLERSKSEAYNKFCKLYELSRDFFNSKYFKEGIRTFGFPKFISAKNYIEFLGAFKKMNDDINIIEKETESLRCGGFVPGYTGSVDAGISTHGMRKIRACNIEAVRKYVEIWKRTDPGGEGKPDNFLGIKLDRKYSNKNKNDNSDIDKIIRDTPIEGIKDSLNRIFNDTTQDLFGELGGLLGGLTASSTTLLYTGSNALAGAAYNLGNKAGNGLTQVTYDILVDGLIDDVVGKKILGVKKESVSKYDGINKSWGLGIGLYERDKNGNITQKKTEGERRIDLIFSTLASAISYYGAPVLTSPLKFAAFEQFLSEPFFNSLSAGIKASIGTENYKGKTMSQSMEEEIKKEYSIESLQKKLVNVVATTLLANLFKATKISKKTLETYDMEDFTVDLGKANEKEIKKIIKRTLLRSINQLNKGTGERHQIIVPTLLCATFKIDSPYLSPNEVINQKIDKAIEGIKTAENQQEQEIYLNTYIDYITLEGQLMNMETKEKRLLALTEETGITIDKTKIEEAEKRIGEQYEKILKESEMINNMIVEITQTIESSIEESLT